MAPSSTVAQLKEQGNALFVQKDFVRAHEKYTEAIAIDGQNAILYANRSACSFGMGKYVDATKDAHQATQIDPGYAKGWSRLATAHDAALEFHSAVNAWQKAFQALPDEEALSPAERKQKEQYAACLIKSKQRLEAVTFTGIRTNVSAEKPPWQVAEEMLPELQAAGQAMYSSSAYLIHFANQEWVEGNRRMACLMKIPFKNDPDQYSVLGHTEGLACISNALMRDMRVFRLDSDGWFDKYNGQVCFESEKYRVWFSQGVEDAQQKALERLKKEGWDSVRPTLSVLVRGWIMRAIFDSEVSRAPHVAVEKFKEILQFLHWGRRVWHDVHKDKRGVIFQDTFVRGVKSIYLETLMAAHGLADSADKPAFLETLLREAQELMQDIEKSSPPSTEFVDPGFVSSFFVYPAVRAHATTGYCFVQLGQSSDNPTEKKTHYAHAVKQYNMAAQALPKDDEKHCWYLRCTIDPMLAIGAPKHSVMPIVEAIRRAMPVMQRIWAHSALAKQGRDRMIEEALRRVESM